MPLPNAEERRAQLRRAALEYHEFPTPGKISIAPTKQLVNQHDLALAYSKTPRRHSSTPAAVIWSAL